MPTRDRKPRRKLMRPEATEKTSDLYDEMRVARLEDWDNGLRKRCIRALLNAGHKPEIAAGIARAWERKPQYIPGMPPRNYKREND